MFVIGLQGSPRKDGNTGLLLDSFLNEAKSVGARICKIEVANEDITPCKECGTCEKEGFCPVNDNMQRIYPLLRQADIVVMATPIFFYGPTAQLKALIDRSQALWARRYIHKLTDPGQRWRKGFLLALGATKGKNLFEGVSLTAKYFFDAIGASFEGSLTYRQIEKPGDIKKHPTAMTDTKEKASMLIEPLINKKKLLFICKENACRSQMAGAFARYYSGDRVESEDAGSMPADDINPVMEEVMKEKGIDMSYRKPKSIEEALGNIIPDILISMGCGDECPYLPGIKLQEWDLPDPSDKPIEYMREIRDEIEERVRRLVITGL
jgi:multimeric flavodoxin WrbA/protein-tyrosine-phosphatase